MSDEHVSEELSEELSEVSASDDADAAASRELGPFRPPSDYAFEAEWRAVPPREIPDEFRQGRFARKRRTGIWACALIGVLCVALSFLPILDVWALFFLPLAWLDWIGVGFLVLAGGLLVSDLITKGPYEYFIEGVPMVARIRSLVLQPTLIVNTQPTQYAFVAMIEFQHPETGTFTVEEVKSTDFSADQRERLTTSFRLGDYVTAVYLPSKTKDAVRLYGFLDLKPDLGVIPRDAQPQDSVLKAAAIIAGVFALFLILFWNIYAYGRYAPIEFSVTQGIVPFTSGAVILGGALLGVLYFDARRSRQGAAERNATAQGSGEAVELEPEKRGWFGAHGWIFGSILFVGALGLGGATMLCWAFTLNAWLDDSPGQNQLVQIDEMIQTTHSFIFREYAMKFHRVGREESLSFLSTPDHMQQFEIDAGLAEVHAGRFGWPWVRTIKPLKLDELQLGE